jgi:hypothetical protein
MLKSKPKLFLFLSIDVINSTALKVDDFDESLKARNVRAQVYSQIKKRIEWMLKFKDLYDDFLSIFTQYCSKSSLEKPKLWKALGDELVFCFKIEKSDDVPNLIYCFRSAINEYEKPAKNGLKFKATAWVAGTPFLNMVIDSSSGGADDYIGPLIDIGFRLKEYANDIKFVVSADLAYILLKTRPKFHIYYDGDVKLKGVFNNKIPYPIYWLNKNAKNNTLKAKLIERKSPNSKKTLQLIREFIKSQNIIFFPFIEKDKILNNKPKYYDGFCKIITRNLENKGARLLNEPKIKSKKLMNKNRTDIISIINKK